MLSAIILQLSKGEVETFLCYLVKLKKLKIPEKSRYRIALWNVSGIIHAGGVVY